MSVAPGKLLPERCFYSIPLEIRAPKHTLAFLGTAWYRLSTDGTARYHTASRVAIRSGDVMRTKPQRVVRAHDRDDAGVRQRILREAFAAFMAEGFTRTSTLQIARRARVSKRELYSLVGNKQAILMAGITARAARMKPPAHVLPRDRGGLSRMLEEYGAAVLRQASDPTVIGVFQLAIAETQRAPEVARTLHVMARESSRAALATLLSDARSHGLLAGNTAGMVEQYMGLLWGTLLINLLLRVSKPPNGVEIVRRAREAAAAFLRIYPQPTNA
jgi:AcrR family transcriptional regulator